MTQSVKDNLLAAFRYLLKPLVRLAVKNAVAFPEFSEVLKQAFVDVARKQFEASGKDPTVEGISLIANIETREVRDILGSNSGQRVGVGGYGAGPRRENKNLSPRVWAVGHPVENYGVP